MTSDRYIQVLQVYLIDGHLSFNANRDVFQQDNASCHTARITKSFIASKNIPVLEWPANSPDLNPIENIWSILKKNIEMRGAKSKEELVSIILEEWNKIDIEITQKVIGSMSKRVAQVIERVCKKCDH